MKKINLFAKTFQIFLIMLCVNACYAMDEEISAVDIVKNINNNILDEQTYLSDEDINVHVYTMEEINSWVEAGNHLKMLTDVYECQFVDDIKQRAIKGVASAYEFLYGEMLIGSVCVNKDVSSGIYYIEQAAKKGYPGAMRKMSFFYEIGRYVQKDTTRAKYLMHEAAVMGYIPAQIDWVEMLLRGIGTPADYEEAYSLLHNSVVSTPMQFEKTKRCLAQLSTKMPPYIVERAKKRVFY